MTREQIIAEIRSLAAEIDRSPGSQLFESWTGLSAHHWRGVYWARWSEALREAGFEPNERQGKADPEVLLEQLAIATRRLGHCPTVDELNIYQQTSAAPSPSTVRHHFGRRASLLAHLKRWAAERPDFADVAALLAADPPHPPPAFTRRRARVEPGGADGVVQLFRCHDRRRFARSGGADGRDRSPLVWIPKSSVLEHEIRTDDPAGVEAYWRRRFAYRRVSPEWYALTPEDVAAFKRWKEI